MIQVGITEARRRLAKLIDLVQSGQTVVITCRGKPVAQIVPVQQKGRRKLPDLSEFRKTLRIKGAPMSQTVSEMRRQARY